MPVVYASSSVALSCLETLVHVCGDAALPLQRWLVAIDVPREHWQQRTRLEPFDLPCWDTTPSGAAPRDWGYRWLASRRSLLAAVPSVIVLKDSTLLINPNHPDCAQFLATVVWRWSNDSRSYGLPSCIHWRDQIATLGLWDAEAPDQGWYRSLQLAETEGRVPSSIRLA